MNVTCVCMNYVYIYIYIFVYTYIHIYIYIFCVYIFIYIYVYMRMFVVLNFNYMYTAQYLVLIANCFELDTGPTTQHLFGCESGQECPEIMASQPTPLMHPHPRNKGLVRFSKASLRKTNGFSLGGGWLTSHDIRLSVLPHAS